VTRSEPSAPGDHSGPSRAQKALVVVTLVLLLGAGLQGTEAWPLTAWRLFSLSRDEDQTRWLVEAVAADGDSRTVSLEELPLRFRHAEWPMADLPEASQARRDEVCEALAAAVAHVEPSAVALRIVRDRQTLVADGGDGWVVHHDPEVVHSCAMRRAS
jgi:hypothetical protein